MRGTVEQVWRAHHDADLLKRWLLRPDGMERSYVRLEDDVLAAAAV